VLAGKLEVCTNLALITVSCIAGFVMLDRHLAERNAAPPAPKPPQTNVVGKQISLAAAGNPAPANVYVAFATTCHFCQESLGFYKKIIADQQHIGGKVKVTFISRQPEAEVRKYLADNGVHPDAVAKVPSELNISGTPTILVSGRDGVVKNQFIGRLSDSKQKDLFKAVAALCDNCGFGTGI